MTLGEAFPVVDPGVKPLGARILLQIKTVKKTTASGIVLVDETKETEKWNTQVAKVVEVGPLAFKNRETGQFWVEGAWVKEGEFVRVPRWGGDRWTVPVTGQEEPAYFVIFNDHEIIGKITGDPLAMSTYIL